MSQWSDRRMLLKMLLKQAMMALGGTGQPHTMSKSYREFFGFSHIASHA